MFDNNECDVSCVPKASSAAASSLCHTFRCVRAPLHCWNFGGFYEAEAIVACLSCRLLSRTAIYRCLYGPKHDLAPGEVVRSDSENFWQGFIFLNLAHNVTWNSTWFISPPPRPQTHQPETDVPTVEARRSPGQRERNVPVNSCSQSLAGQGMCR